MATRMAITSSGEGKGLGPASHRATEKAEPQQGLWRGHPSCTATPVIDGRGTAAGHDKEGDDREQGYLEGAMDSAQGADPQTVGQVDRR